MDIKGMRTGQEGWTGSGVREDKTGTGPEEQGVMRMLHDREVIGDIWESTTMKDIVCPRSGC